MQNSLNNQLRDVYIVDGLRTPFLKARGKRGPFTAAEYAVNAGKALLARQPFAPHELDEVIVGCVVPAADEANIARIVALRLGCGDTVPAYTVQRNCASGLQSLDNAFKDIATGRHDLILAGGTESMSHAPLLFSDDMTNWFAQFVGSKSLAAKLSQIFSLRPRFFAPIFALLKGLNDPIVGLSMGQTAEIISKRFAISREQMDAFSLESHQRLAQAIDHDYLSYVTPLFDNSGHYYLHDDGLRRDSTLEKLAKLKPVFDKKYGKVTAGNSSQITDGAAMLILASKDAVEKHNLPVIARIKDFSWAALDPAEMGLGPAHAVADLLKRNQLSFADIDFMEINEAFAGQVLAVLAAWEDNDYSKQQMGLDAPLGKFDQAKLNVDGGAVALGHPVGASGARLVLNLVNILKRNNAATGVATLCIGGGQGGAVLVESTEKVT